MGELYQLQTSSSVTNLLLDGWIVSTTGQFTHNMKGQSNIISRNRCYGLQPCTIMSRIQGATISATSTEDSKTNACLNFLSQRYISPSGNFFHVFIIGDWYPMVSRSIVKHQLLQILFNHVRKKIVYVKNNGLLQGLHCILEHFWPFRWELLHSIFMWDSLFIMLYKVVLTF